MKEKAIIRLRSMLFLMNDDYENLLFVSPRVCAWRSREWESSSSSSRIHPDRSGRRMPPEIFQLQRPFQLNRPNVWRFGSTLRIFVSKQTSQLESIDLRRELTFSWASGLSINCARWAMAPASTTVWASSGECLAMSDRADAATRFRAISGSCKQRTRSGTAPASTTCCDNSKDIRNDSFDHRKNKDECSKSNQHYVERCIQEPKWLLLSQMDRTLQDKRREHPELRNRLPTELTVANVWQQLVERMRLLSCKTSRTNESKKNKHEPLFVLTMESIDEKPTNILFSQGINELRQNFTSNNSFS